MKWLVDTDVLFAAINRAHERHETSRRWLESVKGEGWGVAVETYLAAVRLLMNGQVMQGHPLGAADALKAVGAEFTGPRAGQVVMGGPPDDRFLSKAKGHKQVMDFYLVQTAAIHRVPLATRNGGTRAAWPEHTFGVA
jgi:predicted nucleic acid-binding protein